MLISANSRLRLILVLALILVSLTLGWICYLRPSEWGSEKKHTQGSADFSDTTQQDASSSAEDGGMEAELFPSDRPPSDPTSQDTTLSPASSGVPVSLPASTRALAVPGKSVAGILQGADLSDPQIRARVVREMQELQRSQQQAVEEKAQRLGIPLRIDGPGHKVAVLYDFRGDEPLYRTNKNQNAAISTGANLLIPSPYNLDGSGIKIGVWDGGSVRSTHQELTGRVTKKNALAINDDHATHVAGTIAASGVQPTAKGMAPLATIDSYDWDSDYAEMTAAGAVSATDTVGLPLSNHSYGFDVITADMGRYETEAASVDAIAASLPFYLPFWAAGNEQDVLTAKGGFQSITFNGLAKNIMTIGAVNDAVSAGVRNINNATIASFSSLGPCDDGRIKPDLVANGIGVYSSVATSDTSYDGTYDGTSMATPNAMGSAILIEQLYAREFSGQRMRASALKALLVHTADDRGNVGPDYSYGWGLMNVKAAADLLLAHKSSPGAPKIIEATITNAAKTATHSFTWDGVSPIRATLCWTDPAGVAQTNADSRTSNLVHNLDAKITAPNGTTVHQPYVMPFVGNWSTASMANAASTGKNNVDNVEQVYVASPSQAGTYTITVSLDGALSTSNQIYSLVVSGGSATLPAITSSQAVTSIVNTAFSYQITATNSPTSFAASGLPAGLSIHPSTGLISGTPTTTGTSNVIISASNASGQTHLTLSMTINPVVTTPVVVFSENIGTPATTTSIAANAFQNTSLLFSGTADVRATTLSSGYSESSGGGNVFITNTNGIFFQISGINTSAYSGLTLSLGHHKNTNSGNNELQISVSSDGLNYTPLSYSRATGSGTAAWLRINPSGTIPSTANLRIKFTQTSTTTQFRIDDVKLMGIPVVTQQSYATWLSLYPLLPLTGVHDDPDNDGQNNLMEYFSGTHPGSANAATTSMQLTANVMTYRYRRAKGLTGVTNTVQWSADLAASSWSTTGITETAQNMGDYEEVTATLPVPPGTPRRFMRLRVSQP
jgi:hypothetical protein